MSVQPDLAQNTEKPLWIPSDTKIEKSKLKQFTKQLENQAGCSFADYHSLWQWSNENTEMFWDQLWDFVDLIGDKGGVVLEKGDQMPGAVFFPNGQINYAENLLRRRDTAPAIIFRDETGKERHLSFQELYDQVSQWQQALIEHGIQKGDRVAAYMPNMPETIIACLAATSLGAIWSSASPDFGIQGVIDRFGQIEPKLLIAVDGYYYNGKTIDCLEKIKAVQPKISSLEKTIIVPFVDSDLGSANLSDTVGMDDFIGGFEPQNINFERVEFNHPLFIMFSSGTTGIPKCIVHGHGGTLIQHLKEHVLHCDVQPEDKVFYFTTCGWMMWNWVITALACEATLLLFDGSPFYPDGNVLWEYTSKHQCMLFGTSAKYIDALKVNDIHPGRDYDLSALKIVTSTGSPLVHESFDYVYEEIKSDVHLASIYGGTDIISASFGIGNPVSPVWRGEIQGAALASAVDVFDDDGQAKIPGEGPGELVCTKPFPSMPVCFWNDLDGSKYKKAYFETYPGVWHHGDWVEKTIHGGFIIHGRSDATLNPGGVRIGTAEIYRQVEQIPQVVESIAVGQNWDGDVRIVLFVVLKEGLKLDDDLIKTIRNQIRQGASPRHMPSKVLQVEDIPRTKSGKITELAVRDVIHGRKVKNVEALANPGALSFYKDLDGLKS